MPALIIMIIQKEDFCHTCVSSANNSADFMLEACMDCEKNASNSRLSNFKKAYPPNFLFHGARGC